MPSGGNRFKLPPQLQLNMKSILALLPLLTALLVSTPTARCAPVPLFDGQTLDGWDYEVKHWRVADGMITGGTVEETMPRNEFIATKKSFHNFELRLKIKISGTVGFVNSGVQIRSVRVPNNSEMSGYQVDAGKGWWGKLYDESRRNKVVATPLDEAKLLAVVNQSDWNEYRIVAEGPRIRSWINGVPALDFTETDPNIALDGRIGLQVHGGGKTLVQVKDITIEELPATPNAMTWEKLGGYQAKPAAKKTEVPPVPKTK